MSGGTLLKFWLAALLASLTTACGSRPTNDQLREKMAAGRPRAAAYGADGFYRDASFQERDLPPPGEFFYKHCRVTGHEPYPIASEWNCSEPQ